jgi:hypothetical protein
MLSTRSSPAFFKAAVRAVPLALCLLLTACAKPEDPARVALRTRLKASATMSSDEIAGMFDQVGHALEGKTVRSRLSNVTQDLDAVQKEAALGMITNRVGVFDEGIRTLNGRTVRVMNAPGRPSNAELDAARHLMIDVETLLPYHFEFTSGVASDEYAFDLVVQP